MAMSLGCAAAAARADSVSDYIQFEAGIGGAAYKNGPDGLWRQDGFQQSVKLTAPAIELGLTGPIIQRTSWGVDWHLGWVWLGTIHSDATVPSANTNTTSGKWVGGDLVGVNKKDPCSGPCNNLSDFKGSGHDQGFMFSIAPHYDYKGWRFGVEGGPYLHRSTWSEDVINWVGARGDTPQNIHVEYKPEWLIGYVLGASISRGNFSVAYQYFKNNAKVLASNPYPPIWQGTHLLLLKYRANVF